MRPGPANSKKGQKNRQDGKQGGFSMRVLIFLAVMTLLGAIVISLSLQHEHQEATQSSISKRNP